MDRAVNGPRGHVDEIAEALGLGAGVEKNEVARLHRRPVLAVRVHEEFAAVGRHGEAEMVGDALVKLSRAVQRKAAARSRRSSRYSMTAPRVRGGKPTPSSRG